MASPPKRGPWLSDCAVRLRPSGISSASLSKQKEVEGVAKARYPTGPGDIVEDSEQALASAFADFDRFIDCTGFVSKKGVQLKVARAV